MSDEPIHSSIKPMVMTFLNEVVKHYWGPLYEYVEKNPTLIKTITGFLVDLEKVTIHIGQTHVGIEYHGSEVITELKGKDKLELEYNDYSLAEGNLLEQIIGFEYDSSCSVPSLPLAPFNENLILPTNKGHDALSELGWNFAAQDSIIAFNTPAPEVLQNQFARIINSFFFDQNNSGLVTRHIKWLDLIPVIYDGSDEEIDSFSFNLAPYKELVTKDAHYKYPLPNDYKFEKLPIINRFIELWGNQSTSEPEITSFLTEQENNFILTMRFGAIKSNSEVTCEWQSEERNNIRPDFFILNTNGYADIVEFKLPNINKNPVVGRNNRETFSAWLSSYIAQTRVYATYFDDPNNRKWFEKKYDFKVYKPRRWLVVGRRNDFKSDIWREIISDYRDIEIITYDDLVDGVVAQFYK